MRVNEGMHAISLIVRIAEALVFATAGCLKLRHPATARAAVRSVGMPGPLVGVGAWGLPLAELAVAVLFVAGASRFGPMAALALLVAFDVALAARALQGDLGLCHCFGRWSGKISGWTMARNFSLAAGAAFLLWSAR